MTRLASGKSSEQARTEDSPGWLSALKHSATARFAEVGYPTTSDEEWRLTNVAPIAKTKFAFASAQIDAEAAELIRRSSFGTDAVAELVFVNGNFEASLSRMPKAAGLGIGTIEHGGAGTTAVLQRNLGQIAAISSTPFVAQNIAWLRDAAVVHIAKGAEISGPVHLLFVSTAGPEPTQSFPRVLLVADDNSQAALVESFVGGGGVHLTNAVTEIVAHTGSRIDYSRMQRGSEEGFAVTMLAARLGRDARFVSHAATLGGKFTRNDLNITLAGEGADATINGLVVVEKDQHCDNHTLLDHAAPNCPSHELYKHVLSGKATCVFKGKILVRQDSQKTDSKQSSKSLLLSDDAQMNSQPALEIYADDVKCTHGSTTGPVDEEMVFYLRSRGVGLDAARHLLTYAFAADITRRIKVEPVRRRLEDFLSAQHGLPQDLRITDLGEHDEKAR
jgi:Fe-S cluster assembly protein SufD